MRKPRDLKEHASYHVIARANRQEMIFTPAVIKELFLTSVRRAKKKYIFIIKNFCIMGSHVHFIIKPQKKASLSKIMQWILSVFALAYNKQHGYTGHVWYDRFVSKIISSLRQYLATFIYIARNPVQASLADHAVDYPYNGIRELHKGIPDLLERPPTVLLRKLWPAIVAPGPR